jgi:hypothetical protein
MRRQKDMFIPVTALVLLVIFGIIVYQYMHPQVVAQGALTDAVIYPARGTALVVVGGTSCVIPMESVTQQMLQQWGQYKVTTDGRLIPY